MEEKRNYGIDLLRIVSMFFIIILHCLLQGGILNNAVVNSNQYKLAWFMETFAYCGVDIFAIISGYVYYSNKERKIKISNYLNLWLQVVFFGILVTVIINIINPSLVTKDYYIASFFPVTNRLYWYFTSYTGLFILMPLINNGIRNTNEKYLKTLFFIIIIVFSLFARLTFNFELAEGYSVIWLIIMYIVGAIIKKCEIGKNLKSRTIIFTILLMVTISYLYKIYGFEFNIISRLFVNKDLLVSYISPTIVIIAIMYVILFSRFKFNNCFNKIIAFVSSSTFAIYILNGQKLFWNNYMLNFFIKIANDHLYKIVLYPIIFTIVFFIGSIFIDKVRVFIFKILHINKIENLIDKT